MSHPQQEKTWLHLVPTAAGAYKNKTYNFQKEETIIKQSNKYEKKQNENNEERRKEMVLIPVAEPRRGIGGADRSEPHFLKIGPEIRTKT